MSCHSRWRVSVYDYMMARVNTQLVQSRGVCLTYNGNKDEKPNLVSSSFKVRLHIWYRKPGIFSSTPLVCDDTLISFRQLNYYIVHDRLSGTLLAMKIVRSRTEL